MTLEHTLHHPPPDTTAPRLSRRGIAWIALGVLALLAACLLGGVAAWLLMLGFAGDGVGGELLLGGVVVPLLALFAAGLGWLAIRHGRDLLRYRARFRYPGY